MKTTNNEQPILGKVQYVKYNDQLNNLGLVVGEQYELLKIKPMKYQIKIPRLNVISSVPIENFYIVPSFVQWHLAYQKYVSFVSPRKEYTVQSLKQYYDWSVDNCRNLMYQSAPARLIDLGHSPIKIMDEVDIQQFFNEWRELFIEDAVTRQWIDVSVETKIKVNDTIYLIPETYATKTKL